VAGATLTDALVNTASPGNTVTYQTTFTNRGSADLDSVIIFETVPEHTALSVATVTVTGGFGVAATPVAVTDFTVEYSINGGNSWSTVVPATLSDTTNVRVLLTNALQPAESGTVSFTVTIQ